MTETTAPHSETAPKAAPKAPRPKAARKTKHEQSREQTVAQIKRVTTEIFVERGYHNCHIEAIARALGMTKGAVYHYYASKDEIIVAILKEIEESIFEAVEQSAADQSATATGRLVVFLNAQASYAVHNARAFCLLVLCAVGFSNGDTAIGATVREIFQRLESIIRDIAEEGLRTGEFTPKIDPVTFAQSVVGAYAGNVIAWQRSGFEPATGRAIVAELRAMILARIALR